MTHEESGRLSGGAIPPAAAMPRPFHDQLDVVELDYDGAPSAELLRSQAKLDEQMRRTSLLTQLAIEFRETLDAPTIAEQTLRLLWSTLGMAYASVILVAPDGATELAVEVRAGATQPVEPGALRSVLDHGLVGWVLRHGSRVILLDVSRDRRWLQFSEQHMAGSVMVLPIRQAQSTMGALTVHRAESNAFSGHDLLLMEGVAAQIGVALRAAQQYRNERHRRDQALALFSMSQFLTVERSFGDLAAMLQDKSVGIFGVDYGLLFLAEGDGSLQPVGVPDRLAGEHDTATIRRAAMAAANAYTQSAIAGDDPAADETTLSCIALPLVHAGQALGAFVLMRAALNKVAFSANTWSLLTIFTNVVAAACANMRLVTRLRHHTHKLEQLVDQRTHQLQHSRDVLRHAFDNLMFGVVLLDNQETVLAANVFFCATILGQHPRTLVGQHYDALWRTLDARGEVYVEAYQPAQPVPATMSGAIKSLNVSCVDASGASRRFVVERTPISGDRQKGDQFLEFWREEVTNT